MILAFDPGLVTGWAVHQDGNIVRSGAMDWSPCAISSLLMAIRARQGQVYCEGQYLPFGGERNVRGVFHLVRKTGFVEHRCAEIGVVFAMVMPSEWQSILPKPAKGRADRAHLKKQSLIKASEVAGKTILDENQADAICLAHYKSMQ